MACPSTRNIEDWLKDLSQLRQRCQIWVQRELENKCSNPVEWKEGDVPGFNPGILSSQEDLASLRTWKVTNPPDRKSIEAEVGVDINQCKWNPKNVRLSDAGVIYALLTLPAGYRIQHLAYDLDDRGDNNQRTLVAWKGVYVFTGGYNDAGWLLADSYPAGGQPFFQAGLVVASSHVKTFDVLNFQLIEAERICIPEDGSSLWLQRLIGPGADATNMNEAIQRGQWLSTAWKNKLSPDAEFKTNDFINFIGIKWGNMPIHTNKTCRKRKKPDSGNEIQDSLQISLHPSPARAETVVGISHDRPVRDSDNSLTFKTLWTELTAVESPPKYWELFTAVGDEDRIALENALSYNSVIVLFQQQVNVLEGGFVKWAYMNFYSYFRTLALRSLEITQPFMKLERQEESDSGPQQYTEIQGMKF
ncbi:hypothetical protein CBS147339_7991 [Penicillium roqueforti]|nr:hypothetical protein CBS147372_1851 [Penicillium roqueforti]KAI2713985.1 hypothetical protein CBS147354_7629 [Penicillium roqueforti]KAI3068861.1 hypothetical protein CBS147339_7991 [Penicillium roqueforti]KAI3100228.1 hypothetical protein CBS147338_3506 [Penicillium roqueforti]KAI3101629.1 hypothetical protein CBS147333_8138 [Penicillium roqueforti]